MRNGFATYGALGDCAFPVLYLGIGRAEDCQEDFISSLLDILVIETIGLYWFTLWMESIICRSREGSLSVSLIDQDFIIVDCFPYLGV